MADAKNMIQLNLFRRQKVSSHPMHDNRQFHLWFVSLQKVEDALQKGTDFSNQGSIPEEDPVYQLIVDCNALPIDIENEIIIIHNFIRDKYRLKFPDKVIKPFCYSVA